jgi:hypothetical protein
VSFVYAPRFKPPDGIGPHGEPIKLRMVRMNKGPFVDARYLDLANTRITTLMQTVKELTEQLEYAQQLHETRTLFELKLRANDD